MPKESHIHTDFMDRQAKENAKTGTTRSIFAGLGLLVLVGIGFGGFQAFQYFGNFETNQLKRNVSVTLKSPKVVAGNAHVSVTIKNNNAYDIANPVFKYEIEGADKKALAGGELELPGVIPAADSRSFDDVALGTVQGQPARMHSDLVTMKVTPNPKLPKGYPARFAGAFDQTGSALIEALKPLSAELPDFEGGHIALGVAYQNGQDLKQATEEFSKAVEVSPASANAHYHLGIALARQGKKAEGDAELKKAVELAPSDETIKKAAAANPTQSSTASDTTEESAE